GHILNYPVDRVVCVGSFVDGFPISRITQRTQHDELSFRFEATTNVLKSEDVPVFNQLLENAARKGSIGSINAVGRAIKKNWQWSAVRLWRVDYGVQFYVVAHWNHLFELVETVRRIGRVGLSVKQQRKKQYEGGKF